MRPITRASSLRLVLFPCLLVGAFACDDVTPSETGRVTVPVTGPVTGDPASYSIQLGNTMVSAARGWHGSITTLQLARTNFTGAVTLSVENLPPGVSVTLPATSFFASAGLQLSVARDAPTGTFNNVLVRGVAYGFVDRTTPLTLTITEALFSIALSSAALTMVQGGEALTTTVNVIRHDFTDSVTLVVDTDMHGSMPPGIRAAWKPNPTTGNSSVLTLTVDAWVAPGIYQLWVWAYTSRLYDEGTPLTLVVTAPAGTSP